MNTKLISQSALDIIDQYKNFRIENAVCSIPYFNNKRTGNRASFRVEGGKGSPKDIYEEIEQRAFKEKIDLKLFDSETLKKFLVDNSIGIDCSGYAYYILNDESLSLGKNALDRYMSFPYAKGLFGKIKCMFRPIENAGVQTFAHEKNSKVIPIKDVQVGDMITMVGGPDNGERDHILIIYQVEYQNFIPMTIHYTHAVAWPTDGEYGHGIHEGKIDILDLNKSLIEQRWTENDKIGEENYTFTRAQKSVTELRRLRWF